MEAAGYFHRRELSSLRLVDAHTPRCGHRLSGAGAESPRIKTLFEPNQPLHLTSKPGMSGADLLHHKFVAVLAESLCLLERLARWYRRRA